MGFGTFWKVMEIDNAIFQYLESFGTGKFFKMAMESLGFLFEKILWIKIDVVLNSKYVLFPLFTVYNIRHNPPNKS